MAGRCPGPPTIAYGAPSDLQITEKGQGGRGRHGKGESKIKGNGEHERERAVKV